VPAPQATAVNPQLQQPKGSFHQPESIMPAL